MTRYTEKQTITKAPKSTAGKTSTELSKLPQLFYIKSAFRSGF